jgi:RNA polymerase sigma-70 factor (ECF subfamily)
MRKLVLAMGRGEEAALAELYDCYRSAVFGLVLRITRDRGAAEEVSLDVFTQAWRQADRFDAAHGTVQSWLFNMARSRAIDRVRAASACKRSGTEDAPRPDQPRRPDEVAETAERRRLVRDAMAVLSAPQRIALELAYYEGLSHSEIAARLGEPLGTVKTRIRQAMMALRQTLTPLLSSP